MVDPVTFWSLAGPLPAPAEEPPRCGLDAVGRPDLTVDGRNLADVLRPAYTALSAE